MRRLNPDFDPESFTRHVREARRRALLLDFDGTLAPFSEDRRLAQPYPGMEAAVERIARDGRTRVGIVSGRGVRDLASHLHLPIELWGSHGLEHLDAHGVYAAATGNPVTAAFVAEACAWVDAQGWHELLERKPFGLALHGRGAPEAYPEARATFLARFEEGARAAGLSYLGFDGGFELRPASGHKGDIVQQVLGEMGDETALAYLGDDTTDEDAFAAIRGRGLGALARAEERPTGADVYLRTPDELLLFLDRWASDGGTPLLAF